MKYTVEITTVIVNVFEIDAHDEDDANAKAFDMHIENIYNSRYGEIAEQSEITVKETNK